MDYPSNFLRFSDERIVTTWIKWLIRRVNAITYRRRRRLLACHPTGRYNLCMEAKWTANVSECVSVAKVKVLPGNWVTR